MIRSHLAERGLRDVVDVDLLGAHRRADRPGRVRALYAIPPTEEEAYQDLWFPAPLNLSGPEELFHTPVYDRGAMTLQALREKVGDEVFFGILREWYEENAGGNVTTADFVALAEEESGQELDEFFEIWLSRDGRPEPGSW